MDSIHALRSTLRFSAQPVSGHLVREILKASMAGQGVVPSWQLVVIDDREILDEIPSFHSSAHMVRDAPVAILVCSVLHGPDASDAWFRACATVSERILIAVQARGLGAVRLSIYPIEERIAGMQRLLGLPRGVLPISLIPLGHPAEGEPPQKRLNAALVHYNHW